MRLSRAAIALIAALILIAVVAGCGGTARVDDPDKFIQQARDYVAKAKAEHQSSTRREKDYQKAIEKYNAIIASSFKEKPQGATALYELGVIYETAPGKMKNLQLAYGQFNMLLNKFDKPAIDLKQRGLLEDEVKQIQALVEQAKDKKTHVADELNEYNKTHPLWGVFDLYGLMDFLVNLTGRNRAFSYWFAIVLVTVIVKLLITPLTKAQFKAMKEMQRISPLIKELQEKYKGDQQVIGQKTMELYKEHGINPFASCLPLLIQMPILLLLFRMVSVYQFQFAKGHFLWIGSALQHKWSVVLPFGPGGTVWVTAGNLSEPDLILVVLYVISMFISTKLSNVDPSQAEQQKMMSIMMPIMFAFIFAGYASAFLLYWLMFNILQTIQQYLILNKNNEPITVTPAPTPQEPSDSSQRTPRRRRRR